eukprot:20223-Heterococcus_DN1.PRE.1
MIRPNAAVASNAQIIAGTWIDLDSTCQETRRASEAAFKQELAWVSHLSLAAVLLPTPKPNACANYARCVNQVTQELNYVQAWVRIPLVHPVEEDSCDVDETAVNDDNSGSSNNSSSSDSSKQQNEDADAMQSSSDSAAAADSTQDITTVVTIDNSSSSSPTVTSDKATATAAAADTADTGTATANDDASDATAHAIEDTWSTWNRLRIMCEHLSW